MRKRSVHGRADHRDLAGGGGRGRGPGSLPTSRDDRDHLLPVAEEVRRDGCERCPPAEATGGRESEAEAAGGGSSAEPPGAEGPPGKQVVTARERRRVVEKVQAAVGVSERRAIRFTGFPRSTMRYRNLRQPQEELRARIRELAAERPRWGYRTIHPASTGGLVGESETGPAAVSGGGPCGASSGQATPKPDPTAYS